MTRRDVYDINVSTMCSILESDYGLVYVLINSAMPDIVKIGMTKRTDLEQRMRELYGTGVPVPFDCAYACKVRGDKTKMLEQALHGAFDPYRVNPKREFFKVKPEQVIAILRFCDEGDATDEVKDEIMSELTQEEKESPVIYKSRRPQLNFDRLGIQRGSVLTYTKDPSIQVTVEEEKKVCYNGEIYSLTAVTRKIMELPENAAIQPTPYWKLGEENLLERYNSVFPPVVQNLIED